MRNRKMLYMAMLVVIIGAAFITLPLKSAGYKEKKAIKELLGRNTGRIAVDEELLNEEYIKQNFPAVERIYDVGNYKAFVCKTVGYIGPMKVLTAIDETNETVVGIKMLEEKETPEYAVHLHEKWWLERFIGKKAADFLRMVVLDPESDQDVVQITGATISSQAVVNAVNSAIGAWQYMKKGVEMLPVSAVVPQEMWEKDENSFLINWQGDSIRVNYQELQGYPQLTVDTTLYKTTGTETQMKVQGALLTDILKDKGVDLSEYQGIGVTGRDGYYTLVDKERLDGRQILIVWKINGEELDIDEKPARLVIPGEMGPYWVRMVNAIDLYQEISPKHIEEVHMFEALTRDIKPYFYEYYGSKKKSIEIGQILKKFSSIDEKGFFSMAAVDGLTKNETISMVRARYYIMVEGENAPMNIAPNFRLGMNVKNMAYFSTTKDAVIFPEKMKNITRIKSVNGHEGMILEDVLAAVGLSWEKEDSFVVRDVSGKEYAITGVAVPECCLIDNGSSVDLIGTSIQIKDIVTIAKSHVE